MAEAAAGTETNDRRGSVAGSYSAYALAVVILAYVMAFVDRQILNILVEPIKRDLALSDTAISLLQGFSFAIVLSLAGLPVGRLIDTHRRTTILTIGISLWTGLTAMSGFAGSYLHLLVCRMGVGIGESAMTPTAYSLIGDYFTMRRLGIATAFYGLGASTGTGLALIFGGAISALVPAAGVELPIMGVIHGWQAAFLLVGIAGLGVAAWVGSLEEPPRRGDHGAPTWTEIAHYYRANGWSILWVNLAAGLNAMAIYSVLAWSPSYFVRTFGMATAEVGYRTGLIVISCNGAGLLCAGLAGDYLRRRGVGTGRLGVIIVAATCAVPLSVAMFGALTPRAALELLMPLMFCMGVTSGSTPATLQEITPGRMRGVQHGIAVLAANMLGLGFGPTVIALLTDFAFGDPLKVGRSLAVALPVMFGLAALSASCALRPYGRSLERV